MNILIPTADYPPIEGGNQLVIARHQLGVDRLHARGTVDMGYGGEPSAMRLGDGVNEQHEGGIGTAFEEL